VAIVSYLRFYFAGNFILVQLQTAKISCKSRLVTFLL
jgi:hypothetical protein